MTTLGPRGKNCARITPNIFQFITLLLNPARAAPGGLHPPVARATLRDNSESTSTKKRVANMDYVDRMMGRNAASRFSPETLLKFTDL